MSWQDSAYTARWVTVSHDQSGKPLHATVANSFGNQRQPIFRAVYVTAYLGDYLDAWGELICERPTLK